MAWERDTGCPLSNHLTRVFDLVSSLGHVRGTSVTLSTLAAEAYMLVRLCLNQPA
jgi:hypothetical protein